MNIKTKFPPPLVALTFGFLINYTKNIFPKIEIKNQIIFGSFMIISGLIIILSAIIQLKYSLFLRRLIAVSLVELTELNRLINNLFGGPKVII